MTNKINVYLESGSQRTFAAALDWPGWCRIGRDEASALQALVECAPRYARVVGPARLKFQAPSAVTTLVVVERLAGNTTTDFGAPNRVPAYDSQPVSDTDLRRLQSILKACWRAFDAAVEKAHGKTLSVGPRGGGRNLAGVRQHVLGAEASYLTSLGGKSPLADTAETPAELVQARQAILKTLTASAHGEVAAHGPRGGKRWPPSYFVRRVAWHVLDHLWEIEDRSRSN